MASWVTATQRYLIQNIVRPVAQLMKKNAKCGAVWQMNACRTWLPGGSSGAGRSIRSLGDAKSLPQVTPSCQCDCPGDRSKQ